MKKSTTHNRNRNKGRKYNLAAIREFRLPDSLQSELVQRYFEALDCPEALSCYLLWKHGEHEQLARKSVNPDDYVDGFSFRRAFCAISFLRKDPSLKVDVDKTEAALLKFVETEERCAGTNRRFRTICDGTFGSLSAPMGSVLETMRHLIKRVLGRFSVEEMLDYGTWGPGATLSCKSFYTAPETKYGRDRDITASAYQLFWPCLKAYAPLWLGEAVPRLKEAEQVLTVSKTALTERVIRKGPGLNSWLQLGLGRVIRQRLRQNARIDLNSDKINQVSSWLGSVDGSVVTLDFSAASDTISYELVKFLLPRNWFTVLDALRCVYFEYECDGVITRTRAQSFSAMGNGYTFELESLIFWALSVACCKTCGVSPKSVTIFGDDVVLPSHAPTLDLFEEAATFCGFSINRDKSFTSGNFRESCGSYFFAGVDSKPIYKKGEYRTCEELFSFANAIRRLAHVWGGYLSLDKSFRNLWDFIVTQCLPKSALLLKGPAQGGDGVLWVNADEGVIRRKPRGGLGGFEYTMLVREARSYEADHAGVLLQRYRYLESARLGNPSLEEFDIHDPIRDFPGLDETVGKGNEIVLRSKTRLRLNHRAVSLQWYDFGPWL